MLTPDDPRHGTDNGYRRGCRLDCCRKAHSNALRRQRRRKPRISLPASPLEPYWEQFPELPQPLKQAAYTAMRRGQVSLWTADRIAVSFGLHPALIWGDAWWDEEEVA